MNLSLTPYSTDASSPSTGSLRAAQTIYRNIAGRREQSALQTQSSRSTSSAYRVSISKQGQQLSKAEFDRKQQQDTVSFKRGMQQKEAAFNREQQQTRMEFERNERQKKADFNRRQQQDSLEFERSRQQEEARFERQLKTGSNSDSRL